jgi:hypothetical protein
MEEEERKIRTEAWVWYAGTLLVAALAVFTAWHSARHNARIAEEMRATHQVAPVGASAPRTP